VVFGDGVDSRLKLPNFVASDVKTELDEVFGEGGESSLMPAICDNTDEIGDVSGVTTLPVDCGFGLVCGFFFCNCILVGDSDVTCVAVVLPVGLS
jgi:hypothetical protein